MADEGGRAAVLWPVVLTGLPMVVLGWARYRLQLPLGDEPHYLVISEALLRYHSLDVQRVYDARDYWAFFPQVIEPHVAPGPDGTVLPLHAIGGPVLWLLPFALFGRAGVIGFMIAISLLIVSNVYWLARTLSGPRVAALVATAFGIGTPVLTYSSLSFVEPIGALGCVYALRLLQQRALRDRDLLAVSAVLGALPWVHGRFLLFPVVFLAFLAVRVGRGRLLPLLGPAAVLLTGLEAYNLLVWHTLNPAPNQVSAGAVPFSADLTTGLLGTFLDPAAGLLPHFPVVLLVLPGLLLARGRRSLTLPVLVASVPYLLVVASFPAWAGAFSPPSRFLAVVLPLFAGHVALAVRRSRVALGLMLVLAGAAGVMTAVAVWTPDGGFSAQPAYPTPLVLGSADLRHMDTYGCSGPACRSHMCPCGGRGDRLW